MEVRSWAVFGLLGERLGRSFFPDMYRRIKPLGRRRENAGETLDGAVCVMNGTSKNLILIGMPGCGKSTVGRELAQRLGRPLVDLDEEIEREAGASIPEIFARQGEEAFRNLEHQVLMKATRRKGVVIATGGGVVTRAENLEPMHQNSVVIFLRRNLELLPREGRPVSQRDGIETLYRQRLPLYQQAADMDVYNQTVEKAASEIIERALPRLG